LYGGEERRYVYPTTKVVVVNQILVLCKEGDFCIKSTRLSGDNIKFLFMGPHNTFKKKLLLLLWAMNLKIIMCRRQ
jgi:hypothetical protein